MAVIAVAFLHNQVWHVRDIRARIRCSSNAV